MTATVLYIEDNSDNLTLVKRAMEAAGYNFIGAQDGLSGLRIAEAFVPDLILLDINLPDMDGYELARRLRSSKKAGLNYVPIVAITANVMRGDAEKTLAAGCDVYMPKPINVRELWARVETLLQASKMR